MKRFFKSDHESDALIEKVTKLYGLKIGEFINMAIKNELYPVTDPFRTEAAFLLQSHTDGKLDAWVIKQSMSRGIRALSSRPARNAEHLQGFFAHYYFDESTKNCTIVEGDALWEPSAMIYSTIGKKAPMDGFGKMDGSHLVDEIFAHWNALWGKAATYDVLATLAYRCEPCKPFDWFDGISFLSDIERDALAQWSGGTNRSE